MSFYTSIRKRHFTVNWANGKNRQFSSSRLQTSTEVNSHQQKVSSSTSLITKEVSKNKDNLLFKYTTIKQRY